MELVKLNVQLVLLVQEMTVTSLMLMLAPIVDLALEFAQLVHQTQPNNCSKGESPEGLSFLLSDLKVQLCCIGSKSLF